MPALWMRAAFAYSWGVKAWRLGKRMWSSMGRARLAGTAQTATATVGNKPSASLSADNGQFGLELRFVFDACANGQQIKCLTMVDEYTREALAIDVAGSIRSARVIDIWHA